MTRRRDPHPSAETSAKAPKRRDRLRFRDALGIVLDNTVWQLLRGLWWLIKAPFRLLSLLD